MFLDSLPSCFSIPTDGTDSTTNELATSAKMPESLVSCIYQSQVCKRPVYVSLTWSRTLSSHTLTINIDTFSLSIVLSPSSFSLFKNKTSSKSFSLSHLHHQHKCKLHWDFTLVKYSAASAEPVSGFFLAISQSNRIEFLVGDLHDNATHHSKAASCELLPTPLLLSRREHIFGQRKFSAKAWFVGSSHEVVIEIAGGALRLKVDGKVTLVVKRLAWKFRGKERFLINGSEVEFYWDVYKWVFEPNGDASGDGIGPGVFAFQVGDGGVVWPEIAGPEKRLMKKSMLSSSSLPANSSVMQWAEEGSEGGSSRSSSSTSLSTSSSSSSSSSFLSSQSKGFTLLLYAWRTN